MEVWTEVITEDVVVVHVGGRKVISPISDTVEAKELDHVLMALEAREVSA
jgi:uncharacterized membrane protein